MFFKIATYYLRLTVIWLIVFALYRVMFLFSYTGYLNDVTILEQLGVFIHAFRLDLSAIGYLLALPFIFKTVQLLINDKRLKIILGRILFLINSLFALLVALISAGELGTYGEWEGKLSAKIFVHLAKPSEVFATASTIDTVRFLIVVTVLTGSFALLYRKWLLDLYAELSNKIVTLLTSLFLGGIFFLMIRGWQPIPIQLSNAYFSSNQFLNDVAVNTFWSFANSIDKMNKGKQENPFDMVDTKTAQNITNNLFSLESNQAPEILKNKRPNIVFIILEGWSGDMIESLGGYKDIAPEFEKLSKEGLLFDDFYSAGWTSDQAMSAIFSSAVVFPNYTIINDPEFFRKLPAITDELHPLGYNSSYFFGGDLDYGNIKAYLLNKNFQLVKDEEVYDEVYPRGKLGVQDAYMFQQYIKEIDQLKEPFFTNLFTLSTHSPYDYEGKRPFDWGDDENNYINSINYADSCLGKFFELAKPKKWYSNTLFVVVSDHTHASPKMRRVCDKNRARVPLLFYGDVLKYKFRGYRSHKIGNHLDISSTLLNQLDVSSDKYIYSKNLLDTISPGFATFTFHNGIGWVNPSGYFGYTFNYKRVICTTDSIESKVQYNVEKEGFSFFNASFNHYYFSK